MAEAVPRSSLNVDSLGSAVPSQATYGSDYATKPFACSVRIEVRGQTCEFAVEQGTAIAEEVRESFKRGHQQVSKRQGPGCASCVMWENIGPKSIRVDESKSNRINWLDKSWATQSEESASCAWPAQRSLLAAKLVGAQSWINVLQLARADGGIDIKDDCRLEDSSARCHQDGANSVKAGRTPALIRLAINVSSALSGRSLDYLQPSSDERFVDGDERASLLVHSESQNLIWHGAAQTTAGYVRGVTQVCHGSSEGHGPCLKRIFTVFALTPTHPLASFSAIERLQKIGITVHALDPRHMLDPAGTASPIHH